MSSLAPQQVVMQTNKRASGRVRKQPELFATTVLSSGTKRKRSKDLDDVNDDVDGDGGMPHGYVSEEEERDDEDEEPDEEELREQRKKGRKQKTTVQRKPAQKKTRVNGVSLPIRNATGGAKRKALKKVKPVNAVDAEAVGGLYAEVFASGNALEDIAGQWVERFDVPDDERTALAEIINFVLRCAGCESKVNEDDIADVDGVTSKLEDLTEEYQATNPSDYPLIAKGKVAAAHRQGLAGLLHAIVKATAAKGTLYDNPVLMENVSVWISTMSSAPNRPFRHTATVAALAIVTALSEVARENAEAAASSQRQAEVERKKNKVNTARVKQIEETVKERTSAFNTVQALLRDWFDTVFIHRYRDVDPLVRRECVAALGEWALTMPDIFFDSHHLRYLGWVLSDSVASTRAEVVKQLHRMYKDTDRVGGLRTFTEKFGARLVELATMDTDSSVRVAGIELVETLRENEMLEPDDIDKVGRLIFDTDARVRKAVAVFFAATVRDLYDSKVNDLGGADELEEVLPPAAESNHDLPRLEWLHFKSLAEMLLNYDADDTLPSQTERSSGHGPLMLGPTAADSRFTLATEALYDAMEAIQDWEALAGYILFDHSNGRANGVAKDTLSQLKYECVLTEREETILLEVLNASVRHKLTSLAEQLRSSRSKLTARQRESLREDQEEAARHLVNILPKLLKKFGDVPGTAAAVLRIEATLNLPALHDLPHDNGTYATLLDDVRRQFMSHGSDEVLAPASSAILHAKSYGELDDLTEEKINGLWDDVVNNLVQLLNPATISIRGASQSEELAALSNNLLRIVRLASVSDCIPFLENTGPVATLDQTNKDYQGAIDYIIALISRAIPADDPQPDPDDATREDEISARAAEAALFYLRWKLRTIITTVTSGSGPGLELEELESLAKRRDSLVEALQNTLKQRRPGEPICTVVAGCLLDLYASAAVLRDLKPKPGMSDDYTALVMDLEPGVERAIMQIFASCEHEFAKLSGKKLENSPTEDRGGEEEGLNDDPMSDPEDDDDDEEEDAEGEHPQTQASQKRREARLLATLIAEQKLCDYTGKLIHALAAGVMTDGAVRKRLERNKARLGNNFKDLLSYLDRDSVVSGSGKGKGKPKSKAQVANGPSGGKKADPKSHALVLEEEMEDDIVDDNDDDADDDEALRRRGLLEDDREDDREEQEVAAGADGDESLIGD